MVINVFDNHQDLSSKGRIVVPCQCYYNARDNLLTEILNHTYNEDYNYGLSLDNNKFKMRDHHDKHDTEKSVSSKCNKKDTSTETPYCCICEQFRNAKSSKTKKDLWNMQFNRWWGWNWQRKRKDLMAKFGLKCENTCKCNSKWECPVKTDEDSMIRSNIEIKCNKQDNKTDKKKNFPNMVELLDPIKPVPPILTYGFKKPYKGRRKQNKYKYRQYEGWVREINSSESEDSNENLKIKMKHPKKPSSKEYMRYLSLRLRKLNSDESIDNLKRKVSITKSSKNKSKTHQIFAKSESELKLKEVKEQGVNTSFFDNAKYVSPISGKIYDLNLPPIYLPSAETNNTDFLNPLNLKDNIISKPKFDWLEHYTLLKTEHSQLLKSICELLHNKETDESSEKIPSKIDNCTTTEDQLLKEENKDTIQDYYYNFNINNRMNYCPKSESALLRQKTMHECCNTKSQQNYPNKSFNIINYKNLILPPQVESIFTKHFNLDNTVQNNTNFDRTQETNVKEIDSKSNYDINYINNNLLSFSSSISDTEFFICRSEMNLNEENNVKDEIHN